MRQSTRPRIVRILLSGVLFAVILGAALRADTAERKSITDEELWQHRPANMFKLSENNDPSVCEPLLASLNTSLRIAPKPQRIILRRKPKSSKPRARSKNRPFPLMRNKFVIDPWQEQKFPWNPRPGAAQTTLTWEAAYLDFDGDGSIDGLFRRRSMISGNSFHSTWFVDAVNDQLKSRKILDQDIARDVIFNNTLSFRKFDPPPHHNRQFIEPVEFGQKPYVLIGRAFYWTLKEKPRFPRVQLLKRTSKGFERVCLFDGLVEIIRSTRS